MNYKNLLKLFYNAGKLKRLKRAGWVRHKIENPESVAEHSFRTAFIAMFLSDFINVDALKLIKMSLIHDLAEILVGDITPHDGITDEEKRKMEEKGLRELLKDIDNGDEYVNLWIEFEEQKTPEAIALRNIDKMEMIIQATEYEKEFSDKNLSEFFNGMDKYKTSPEFSAIFDEIQCFLKTSSVKI